MKINQTVNITLKQSYLAKNRRLGLAAGFVATVLSLPFIAIKASEKKDKNPALGNQNTPQLITDKDFDAIEMLRQKNTFVDKKLQEIKWAEKVYPTIRENLIKLYKAEEEDNIAIKVGKITEKDRKVKIYFADAVVPPDHHGGDLGALDFIHIVKHDGSTYVNEHWPIDKKTGGIMPTEVIRISSKVFNVLPDDPSYKNLFINDQLGVIWEKELDAPNNPFKPYFFKQHIYGDYDLKEKRNPDIQVQVSVDAPMDCLMCHETGAKRKKDPSKPYRHTTFEPFTKEEDFKKPSDKHEGFIKYKNYLDERVKKKELSQKQVDEIIKDLMNLTSFENPNIVNALKQATSVPWVGADIKPDITHPGRDGYQYIENGITWNTAGYELYKDQLFNPHWWWQKSDTILIPKKSR